MMWHTISLFYAAPVLANGLVLVLSHLIIAPLKSKIKLHIDI